MAYFTGIAPFLLEGAKMTLFLWALTLVLSLPLGFLVSLLVRSRFRPLVWLTEIYIYIMRGTPLMLQLMFVYYGLPFIPVVGVWLRFNRLTAAVFAFALNYAAYFAEIFRGGFLAVPKGQYEACQVLGLSRMQTLTKVVVPQMIRVALPGITNETITLVKDTSLAYVIALAELMHAAKATVSRDSNPAAYVLAGLIYLVIVFAVTLVFKKLETRYRLMEK
ncbi:MAG: amino acid ABC transporter permease [Gracilibacteraceae bacterium]|jgi:polar amino acid transport system permease protein|nr:amino acid ABC transporter permease [Gracilibacteraceae bacterium]